jgi:hypothetical protein
MIWILIGACVLGAILGWYGAKHDLEHGYWPKKFWSCISNVWTRHKCS